LFLANFFHFAPKYLFPKKNSLLHRAAQQKNAGHLGGHGSAGTIGNGMAMASECVVANGTGKTRSSANNNNALNASAAGQSSSTNFEPERPIGK
jgi:hypothetical protein